MSMIVLGNELSQRALADHAESERKSKFTCVATVFHALNHFEITNNSHFGKILKA
jgi:hypothetical protein